MKPVDYPIRARVAADYAIAALRNELNLHFEICDHAFPEKYVNECSLTDGESFLYAYFTIDPAPFRGNITSLGTIEGTEIFFHSTTREDSVHQFVPAEVDAVVRSAFYGFGSGPVLDRCVLLSFEFFGASTKTEIEAWFRAQPDLRFERMPEYVGTYRDIEGFYVDDSHGYWGQCVFSPALTCEEVRRRFGGQMRDFDRWDVGGMATFDPAANWQRIGVRKVHIVSRRY